MRLFAPVPVSLPFVFALAEPLKHAETGLLGVGKGRRLQLGRRAEAGNDLAHRLFTGRTMRERLGRQRPVQRELASAHNWTVERVPAKDEKIAPKMGP